MDLMVKLCCIHAIRMGVNQETAIHFMFKALNQVNA